MANPSDADVAVARLWKVNRTIHELIRDRVGPFAINWALYFVGHSANGTGNWTFLASKITLNATFFNTLSILGLCSGKR